MTDEKILSMYHKWLAIALENADTIRNPISWALYQLWHEVEDMEMMMR